MKLLKSKRAIAATVIGAVAVAGTGIAAFGYWTTSGTGSGSATTTTDSGLTITQDNPISGLADGAPAVSVPLTVHNSASFDQYLTSASVAVGTITPAQLDPLKPACTAADFAVGQPTNAPFNVLAGSTHALTGTTIALKDTALNQDNCKNVSLVLTFTSN